ncbi:MAG: hypothetical protein H7Y20_10155, partial [Bryobacteraceae bacterium]|nr:hypothetical protein [Bryobacteraceae bacterium]
NRVRLSVFLFYPTMLLRDATAAERAELQRQLLAGVPERTILEGIINSPEMRTLLQ